MAPLHGSPPLALSLAVALTLVCHGRCSAFPQQEGLRELSILSIHNGSGYTELDRRHTFGTPGLERTNAVLTSDSSERKRVPVRRNLMAMDKRARFAAAVRRRKPEECWSRRERHLFLKVRSRPSQDMDTAVAGYL